MVYNEYIHKGYRINFLSYKRLFVSSCKLHNETTNFWTHFIGGLIFIFLLAYFSVLFTPLSFDIDIIDRGLAYSVSDLNVTDGLVDSLKQVVHAKTEAAHNHVAWLRSVRLESSVIKIIEEMRNLEAKLKENLKSINSTDLGEFS